MAKKEYNKLLNGLDDNVILFDSNEIHRELIKMMRELSANSKFNQFSASIEMISQLILFSNSMIEFMNEVGIIEIYLKDCKDKYPNQFNDLFKGYNRIVERIDKRLTRLF